MVLNWESSNSEIEPRCHLHQAVSASMLFRWWLWSLYQCSCFHLSWDLFKTYPGCPLLPPSSGSLCVPPSEGAHNCSYDGSSGNTYQLETSLVINCCCGQCDTDLTCSPDSASGYGLWQPTHTSLCPENGCGTQGEYASIDSRPSSTCFCHAFFLQVL